MKVHPGEVPAMLMISLVVSYLAPLEDSGKEEIRFEDQVRLGLLSTEMRKERAPTGSNREKRARRCLRSHLCRTCDAPTCFVVN